MPVVGDTSGSIIRLRMIGRYVPGEIREELIRILSVPQAANAVGLLFDVSASESLRDRKPEDVQSVGYILSSLSNQFGGRIALVGATDFSYGMMRLGSAHLNRLGVDNEVFRDPDTAQAWLEKKPEPAGP